MPSRVRRLPSALTEERPEWDENGEYYSSVGLINVDLYEQLNDMVQEAP